MSLGIRQSRMKTDAIEVFPRAKESHGPPFIAVLKTHHSQTHLCGDTHSS